MESAEVTTPDAAPPWAALRALARDALMPGGMRPESVPFRRSTALGYVIVRADLILSLLDAHARLDAALRSLPLAELEAYVATCKATDKAEKKAKRHPRWDRPDDTSGSSEAEFAAMDASLAERRALKALRIAALLAPARAALDGTEG